MGESTVHRHIHRDRRASVNIPSPHNCKVSVAVWGALPPPFGGVSVHVARLVSLLHDRGIAYHLYDRGGQSIPEQNVTPGGDKPWHFLQFLLTVPESVVHLQIHNNLAMLGAALILRMRRKRIIASIHGELYLHRYQACGTWYRQLCRFCLRRIDRYIAVSDRIADWLRELGIPEERIHVAPAFLPPTADQLADENLPEAARRLLETHDPIIGSQGWFGAFSMGRDVYSFALLAELIADIRRQWPRAALYTVVSGTLAASHREAIFQLRRTMGLEECWLLLEEPFHAAALYQRSRVFVRPTTTDGDSVSIRECLCLAVPVVASDAVVRPRGCVLFKNLDRLALASAVRATLRGHDALQASLRLVQQEDFSRPIIDLYRDMVAISYSPDTPTKTIGRNQWTTTHNHGI